MLNSSLYNLNPDDSLAICSDNERNTYWVEKAVKAWLAAVGRENKIRIVGTCDNLDQYDGVIKVQIYKLSETDQKKCERAAAFTRVLSSSPITHRVVFCPRFLAKHPSANYYYNITLHETGHMFGMCDQYSVDYEIKTLKHPIGMHENCSATYRSLEAHRAVMNAGIKSDPLTSLTDDDIAGAKQLIARLGNQKIWTEATSQTEKPENTDKPAKPTTPDTNKPSNPSNNLLDCNKDYPKIRTSNISGICLNRSSMFCYRYGNRNVLYHLGRVKCPNSQTSATNTKANDNPKPSNSNPESSSHDPVILDCNADYRRIRTRYESGFCINRSSGFCYRYGRGDVQYHLGSVACPRS